MTLGVNKVYFQVEPEVQTHVNSGKIPQYL